MHPYHVLPRPVGHTGKNRTRRRQDQAKSFVEVLHKVPTSLRGRRTVAYRDSTGPLKISNHSLGPRKDYIRAVISLSGPGGSSLLGVEEPQPRGIVEGMEPGPRREQISVRTITQKRYCRSGMFLPDGIQNRQGQDGITKRGRTNYKDCSARHGLMATAYVHWLISIQSVPVSTCRTG